VVGLEEIGDLLGTLVGASSLNRVEGVAASPLGWRTSIRQMP
jgi:hypothetical protein